MGSLRFLTDEQLLAQCREDRYRGSGPGGQKRNKTSNAVRLAHLGTGLLVTATEARSLMENQKRALHRMRLKLAIEVREAVELLRFEPPDWLLTIRRQSRLEVSGHHPLYPAAIGLALDLLEALSGNPAAVAANLGISTSALIKLLESDPHAWTAANNIRGKNGAGALTHRR